MAFKQFLKSYNGVASRGAEHGVGDLLFFVQIACALSFGVAQARLMYATSTQGVSVTWLAFWSIFLLINLSLSIRAHQAQASRVTAQTVVVYALWSLLLIANSAVFLWRGAQLWTAIDTLTCVLAGLGIVTTLVVAAHYSLALTDAIVRGYFGVFFKVVPQLMLAWNIWLVGGAGVSVVGIIIGHIAIGSRLGQIIVALREAGWDRNRRGALISEAANEGSWIIASIAWLLAG